MNTDFSHIPATEGVYEGVYKVTKGEGERFDVAGARFTWKVKGDKTAYAFSVYEQTLDPEEGVPPHSHACAEVFYLLEGAVDFLRIMDGKKDWVRCESGETLIVPPNALHAFFNKTSAPSRLLSISTHLHQAFFDEVARIDLAESFSTIPLPEAMGRVAEIASRYHMHFVPPDGTKVLNRTVKSLLD
jgi:quercetin dioxygenase-like cupin family protein